MPKAVWNGKLIAESEETVVVEGSHYFPRESVVSEYLKPSSTHSDCPWKGVASYLSLVVDSKENTDAAWFYPEPKKEAATTTRVTTIAANEPPSMSSRRLRRSRASMRAWDASMLLRDPGVAPRVAGVLRDPTRTRGSGPLPLPTRARAPLGEPRRRFAGSGGSYPLSSS